MKKISIFLAAIIFLTGLKACSDTVFSHKVDAQTASSSLPVFESTSCNFSQNKILKTSQASLQSSGNFKFIKGNGVVFETTHPVYSTASYTSSKNNIVNAIIQSISTKNYSYLEKNFDIFYTSTGSSWILALKPKSGSSFKSELDNIQIWGSTKNQKGTINKIIIDNSSIKTILDFTNCG